jgi:hypothetical protein
VLCPANRTARLSSPKEMSTTVVGVNDEEKLNALCRRTYKEQAVWFLNSFWEEFGKREAEKVWAHVYKAEELDKEQRAAGSQLDEFTAHRFLEHFNEAITVSELRDKLRAVGAIPVTGQIKKVPLLFFLIVRYVSKCVISSRR